MKLKDYFKNLSNTWSGNYLATLGFVIFMFTTVGAISRIIQGITNHYLPYIKNVPSIFLEETISLLPITCLLAIVPIVIITKFLIKPKYNTMTQFIIYLISVFLCVCRNIFADNYMEGSAIAFVFIPFVLYPIVIITVMIYLGLLFLDLKKNIKIKNTELINNRYYKKLINIFYWYVIIVIPASFFILASMMIYSFIKN